MRDAAPLFEPLGARLHIVGNGTPAQALDFAGQYDMEDAVWTDPGRHLYQALGMVRAVRSTLNLETLKNGLRAFTQGFRYTRVEGDPWQQGGTLVITQDGTILYRYLSQVAGDHAPLASIVAALKTAMQ